MKNEFDLKYIDFILVIIFSFLFYKTISANEYSWGIQNFISQEIKTGDIHSVFTYGGIYILIGKIVYYVSGIEPDIIIKNLNYIFAAANLVVLLLICSILGFRRWASLLTVGTVGINFIYWKCAVNPDTIMATMFFISISIYFAMIGFISQEKLYIRLSLFFYSISLINSLIGLLFLPAYFYFILKKNKTKERMMLLSLLAIFIVIVMISEIALFMHIKSKEMVLLNMKLWVEYGLKDLFFNNLRMLLNIVYGFPVFGFIMIVLGTIFAYKKSRKIFIFLLIFIIGIALFNTVSFYSSINIQVIVVYICGIFLGYTLNKIASIKYETYEKWFLISSGCFIILIILPVAFYSVTPQILYSYKIRPSLYKYSISPFPEIRDLDFKDSITGYLKPWYNPDKEIIKMKNSLFILLNKKDCLIADPEIFFSMYNKKNNIVFVRPDRQLDYIDKNRAIENIYITSLEDYFYNKNSILEKYRFMKSQDGRFFKIVERGKEWKEIEK